MTDSYLLSLNMSKIVAVVGSRAVDKTINERIGKLVIKYVHNQPKSNIYISGGASSGADYWIRKVCSEEHLQYLEAPAFWNKLYRYKAGGDFDRTAGIRRNVTIAQVCNEAAVFWDGRSNGTRHIMGQLHLMRKPMKIIRIDRIHPLDQMPLPKRPPVNELH